MIKSDSASGVLPSIDLEIPPNTQKGEISTIEGMLSKAAKNLSLHQAERMKQNPRLGHNLEPIQEMSHGLETKLVSPVGELAQNQNDRITPIS